MCKKILCKVGRILTNEERQEGRYLRRKQKRLDKRKSEQKSFDEIFTFESLYKAYKRSKKGVIWKSSVQTFKTNVIVNIHKILKEIHSDKYKMGKLFKFQLYDRGKLRDIQALTFKDRIVQHAFCDDFLMPTLSKSLIYDNSGSIENKGMDFALKRIRKHLSRAYREYGNNKFYVLKYDFKGYFSNINHEQVMKQQRKLICDKKTLKFLESSMDIFGDKGVGLGSQISQYIATSFPNEIDHYFKDKQRMKYYGRYMDDGYLFFNDDNKLIELKDGLFELCEKLDIPINFKKTEIRRLDRGFSILKMRWNILENGKIIQRVSRNTIKRQRIKLKKLHGMLKKNKITYQDFYNSYISMDGHLKRSDNFNARKNLRKLYNQLVFKEEYYVCN